MQQTHSNHTPFLSFRHLSTDLTLLHAIAHQDPQLKTKALLEGCLRRKSLNLYRGNSSYYDDLQIILDHDRENGPAIFKNQKIALNKFGTNVLPQCIDCGKYNLPFKFCENCEHIHYCSDGCEVRSKISHQRDCRPKLLPGLDTALQVEVHIGSDLGHNIEVYFQHEMRMSLQMRGEKLIKTIFDYYNGQGKPHIPENFTVQIFNKHLRYRKQDESKYITINNGFTIDSLQNLIKLYKSNPFLSSIELLLLGRGGILWKQIKEIHNNSFHLAYIFLCCD